MDLKRNDYQRTTSWNAPYTFSGKEKDVETGYGYVKKLRFFSSLAFGNGKQVFHYAHCLRRFGARYYDSGLSIWLSVDPMSDKYPSMSPYNYCANNPVILVDPDGREVIFNSLIDVIVVGTQLLFNSHFRENYKALKNSTETYLFRGSKNYNEGKGGKFHTNGEILIIDYNLSKDGKGNNCFTNIRHETEHANQFEHGELGFDNQGNVNVDNNGISTPNWNNSATNYDVYDELNAWNAGYYGFFSGDAETSDRVYFMRLNETEKIEDLSRTYPNASSIIKNNTNTARIKTNTQYLLPYKPRN